MNLTIQLIGFVGTIVGLLAAFWKVAQWFARIDQKQTATQLAIRRLELRMRSYDRRMERLENEEKPPWR